MLDSPPSPTIPVTRRGLFQQMGAGLYSAALAQLLSQDVYGDESGGRRGLDAVRLHQPQHEPRARAVIHLFMNGGPSQMDLFDPKPELNKRHGEEYFNRIADEVEFPESAGALFKSPFRFAQHGECGMWVSELMPHFATQVDKVSLIRSMHTTNLTHEPALYKIHSGSEFPERPSLGAWVTYGLGTENQDLPAYVVLDDPLGLPVIGIDSWQCGYLPPTYQGTRFRATGQPVLDLKPDYEVPESVTRIERDLIARLDRIHRRNRPARPELAARIATYELAARMQMRATSALDLSQETAATQEMYGINEKVTESYGRRCLIARRLIERGVRFVQLFIDGQIWDTHNNIGTMLKTACDRTDKPVAGLLEDLDQRGLLEDTLVLWGGEFGRLPIAQLPTPGDGRKAGRDHNKNAFVAWLAGGGVKSGFVTGETDELGFSGVKDRVSVTDWHATLLYLLGMHHEELFYERNGLKERLTGVSSARVIQEIIA